ncbi:uncharacterized protein K441DRAFT_589902, partial [Cenococcum geophilum 1.58]
KVMATANDNGIVRLWSLKSGACVRTLNGHANTILCLTLRDNLLVSGSNNTTIRIWDLPSG